MWLTQDSVTAAARTAATTAARTAAAAAATAAAPTGGTRKRARTAPARHTARPIYRVTSFPNCRITVYKIILLLTTTLAQRRPLVPQRGATAESLLNH